jgi:hypothetical protein
VNETVELVNGQVKDVAFSNPQDVQIYVSADLTTTDEYEGDEAVTDSITSYIGGIFTSGNKDGGKISVGDDVIYGEIEYAIRDVDGVFDITSLTVGKTASPTGTGNITIEDFELAVSDGTDSSISVTTT